MIRTALLFIYVLLKCFHPLQIVRAYVCMKIPEYPTPSPPHTHTHTPPPQPRATEQLTEPNNPENLGCFMYYMLIGDRLDLRPFRFRYRLP